MQLDRDSLSHFLHTAGSAVRYWATLVKPGYDRMENTISLRIEVDGETFFIDNEMVKDFAARAPEVIENVSDAMLEDEADQLLQLIVFGKVRYTPDRISKEEVEEAVSGFAKQGNR